ncbi:hypothetical protein GCM10007388_14590 [Pseudoduganella plicata]|uniref:Uncharacterized protein n=1 Tax=Pseudoduganella plicata TaxID=321984 RepID=A0AA88C7S6_9BURK|nr:hypothetical protein GCM10007388_14590 [Pseudoduganella plicata]
MRRASAASRVHAASTAWRVAASSSPSAYAISVSSEKVIIGSPPVVSAFARALPRTPCGQARALRGFILAPARARTAPRSQCAVQQMRVAADGARCRQGRARAFLWKPNVHMGLFAWKALLSANIMLICGLY